MGNEVVALVCVVLERCDHGFMDGHVPGFAELRLANHQNSSLNINIPIFQGGGFAGPQSRGRQQTN
jgi:hypothetical protein